MRLEMKTRDIFHPDDIAGPRRLYIQRHHQQHSDPDASSRPSKAHPDVDRSCHLRRRDGRYALRSAVGQRNNQPPPCLLLLDRKQAIHRKHCVKGPPTTTRDPSSDGSSDVPACRSCYLPLQNDDTSFQLPDADMLQRVGQAAHADFVWLGSVNDRRRSNKFRRLSNRSLEGRNELPSQPRGKRGTGTPDRHTPCACRSRSPPSPFLNAGQRPDTPHTPDRRPGHDDQSGGDLQYGEAVIALGHITRRRQDWVCNLTIQHTYHSPLH
ncbi:hypothetical protein B0T16DRAFT_135142 [Cercophora newfieldiana]|uniref:Uncharacterized protein n=1 Tax=Cercophora newfieldiana TaxID=92897 RepID=A0AA39YBL4_9PEZI|nr:hypothetical protein B0T16DRAFT_135142 [Cercophora newfieldiana]